MHLKYDLQTSHEFGVKDHPQGAMEALGISYQDSTPQSIADQWWFWNCKSIPEILPPYLTELNADPLKCVGFGLSQEQAEKIAKNSK